jgi:diguanylate cyclase (GGDEF)-like protein
LIITHGDKQDAKSAVERIRKQFESTKFTFGNSTTSVTVSFGIAGFCGGKPELNTLVSRADAALYAAKRNGRNKLVFDDDV